MLSLTIPERLALKGRAHPLKPTVMIGNAGLTASVLKEIALALENHELIKIRVMAERPQREAILMEVCEKLDASSTQALVRFLFEESYKEYELVMVYSYMQIHIDNLQWYDIFDDLIYESYFHLKSFGNLMSDLGILSIPRTIIESIYMLL
jgi:RNA-binding protein YhbY